MSALAFQTARRRHVSLARAIARNEESATALWTAITQAGADLPAGSYAEAVRDTFPEGLASVLASNAVAAAFAFDMHAAAMTERTAPVLLRDLARANWKTVSERAASTEKLAAGFGWDLSAAWEVSSDVASVHGSLAEVERIASLAGRMYASLRGSNAKRIPGSGGEVYSIEQGNAIGRLLASEQMLLMDPLLEITVLERVASRRALQYAVRGTEKASRGPLVVLIDESGSMQYDSYGQPNLARNRWAKAAAVALCRVAKDDCRPFVAVHYSSSVVAKRIDPASPSDVIGMVRHFLNGGTHIGMALAAGLDEVAALAASGARGADIILITDGVDDKIDAQAAQVARAKAADVRLWTVAIECQIPESSPLRAAASAFIELGGAKLDDGKTGALLAGATQRSHP